MVHWVVGCLRRTFKVWILKFLLEAFKKIPNCLLTLSQKTSRHAIYFKVIRPNKYFQIYSRKVWARNDQISKKDRKTTSRNS